MAKNIEVTLTLNDRGFARKAKSAEGQIAKLGRTGKVTTGSIAGLAARFAAVAAPIVAATAAFRSLGDALDVSAQFEATRVTLSNIIGSAEGGQAAFNALREVALELPIAFNELSSAAPALATVSKDINALEENTRLAADIAANFGIPFETAAGQIQRSFSAGAGAADVFREKGVLAAAGFEAGVSYSVDETIAKIREFGSTIEGASAQLNTTFAGAANQAGDAFELFQESIGNVILPEAQAFLETLLQIFRDNRDAVLEFGKSIGTGVVAGIKAFARGIATAIDIVLSLGQTAKRIGQAIKQNFGEQIRVVANAVVKAFGGIVEGISLVGVGIGKLISATTGVTDVEDFFNNINEAANKVRREGLTAIDDVSEGIGTMIPVTTTRDMVDDFIDQMDETVVQLNETRQATEDAADAIGGDLPIALAQSASAASAFTDEITDIRDKFTVLFGRGGLVTGVKQVTIGIKGFDAAGKELKTTLLALPLNDVLSKSTVLAQALDFVKTTMNAASIEIDTTDLTLQALREAMDSTILTSQDFTAIQRIINDLLEAGQITIKESIDLYNALDEAFADQEGVRSFTQALGQAQVSLSTDLATALLEGRSAMESFKNFFKQIVTQIVADILRLQIIQPLLGAIFGVSFGAGGAVSGLTGGGLLGMFGGGKAMGGPVMKNKPYLVGERGPELFVPGASGNIVPNNELGGGSVQNVYINAIDTQSFKTALAKQDPEFIFALTQAGARRLPA